MKTKLIRKALLLRTNKKDRNYFFVFLCMRLMFSFTRFSYLEVGVMIYTAASFLRSMVR